MSSPWASIIIDVGGPRTPLLRRLLAQIEVYTHDFPYEVIVACNCEDVSELRMVKAFVDEYSTTCRLVILPAKGLPRGVASAFNAGLAVAGARDLVVHLDPDTAIIAHGWLWPCARALSANPKAAIGGDVWGCGGVTTGAFKHGEYPTDRFEPSWWAERGEYESLPHVQGGMMAMRRSVVDALGGFHPAFGGCFVDVEYSWRALSYGWELLPLGSVHCPREAQLDVQPHHKVLHPVRDPDIYWPEGTAPCPAPSSPE